MGCALYLFFNGNCEEAMNFYKDKLGGNIEFLQRFKDAPMPAEAGTEDKIMHATMDIQGSKIMFSDSGGLNVTFGNNFSISLDFNSDGEIERAFTALSEGGTVTMALDKTFWGSKFGMCTDKFGVNWMFSFELPKE